MESTPSPPSFPARFASLADVLASIDTACAAAGIADNVRLRAELAIEELFANTIHYGYGGEGDRPVWIDVHGSADGLEIEYRDAGPAFNPLEPSATDIDAPPDEREVGGLGRLLVRELTTRCGYRREDNENIVCLLFGHADPDAM